MLQEKNSVEARLQSDNQPINRDERYNIICTV